MTRHPPGFAEAQAVYENACPEDADAGRPEPRPAPEPAEPASHVVHGRRYYAEDFLYDPIGNR